MEQYTIKAQVRTKTRKKAKSLREQGVIPAAIFGYKGNYNIQINEKDFSKLFAQVGNTKIVDVDLDGETHSVYINEVQRDPVTRRWIHVSFREVKMDEEITASIPFVLVGADESPAVKNEQMLVILSLNEIELKGLPSKLPSEITLDVSGFHAGDVLKVKDIKLPEGVKLVHDSEEDLEEVIVTTTSAIQDEAIENVQAAIEADVAAKNVEASSQVDESSKHEEGKE